MSTPPTLFEPVFQGKEGFGGYSPLSPNDHAFAYDGNSSGKRDHIVWYRSGGGICSVIRPYENYEFGPIYQSLQGIGGWDFGHVYDRAFAFDYDHSGKMDHIVCYRPAAGAVFIIRHDGNGQFGPIYAQAAADKATEDAGNGIGGYDLRYPWDRMICFDFDKSGKNDALFLYRRWCGRFCVLKNNNGRFEQAYHDWCFGIGGYLTQYEGDYAFAFDYSRTGKFDHILFLVVNFDHSPWCGVVTRQDDKFVTVWKNDSALFGGFPKTGVWEIIGLTYDFESSGKIDHFGMYWMNHGYVWIMNCPKSDGNWNITYEQNGGGIGNWDALGAKNDRCIAFDFDGSGKMDHLFIYRRTTGAVWILRKMGVKRPPKKIVDKPVKRDLPDDVVPPVRTTSFDAVMRSDGEGVAGFDFSSPKDHIFAFDYDHSGKLDHLVVVRPGGGAVWIIKNDGTDSFTSVYMHGDGIGGYDMKNDADRGFAFDYEHSGKMDCMILYRPGGGLFCILQNKDGQFTPVYNQNTGIATYDFKVPADRAFAFDYEHSGKRDYICMYRPGGGVFWILKNVKGAFETVVKEANGIAGYDLRDARDRAFAFDYDKSGKMDHIFVYRPGVRIVAIVKNQDAKLTSVYFQNNAANNWGNWRVVIGGYDLDHPADKAFPYDHDGTGRLDHVCFYRPGTGRFTIVRQAMGGFAPIYQGFAGGLGPYANKPVVGTVVFNLYSSDGEGIGTFDVRNANDHLLPFDFKSTGRSDHIVAYRPGAKVLHVLRRTDPPPPPPQPEKPPAEQPANAPAVPKQQQ